MVVQYDIIFKIVFYNLFFQLFGVFGFLLEVFSDFVSGIKIFFQVDFIIILIKVVAIGIYVVVQYVYRLIEGECNIIFLRKELLDKFSEFVEVVKFILVLYVVFFVYLFKVLINQELFF